MSTKNQHDLFLQLFLPDEFLSKWFGSRKKLLKQAIRIRKRLLLGGLARVYTDATLAEALESGELKKSKNPLRRFFGVPFVINTRQFRETFDPWCEIRERIGLAVLTNAMIKIRWHEVREEPPERVYLFKGGRFAEGINTKTFEGMFKHPEAFERELYAHLRSALHHCRPHEDAWWRYEVSETGNDIYLEPVRDARELYRQKVKRTRPPLTIERWNGEQWERAEVIDTGL